MKKILIVFLSIQMFFLLPVTRKIENSIKLKTDDEISESINMGDSDDLISAYEIGNNFKKHHLGSNDILVNYTEVSNSRKIIGDVDNANQSILNSNYNYITGREGEDRVNGTCSIVAASILIDWYIKTGRLNTSANKTIQDIFNETMSLALENKYTTVKDGTATSKMNDIIDLELRVNFPNTSLRTQSRYTFLVDRTIESIDNGIPVIFGIEDHDTVGKGYATYNFQYDEYYQTFPIFGKWKYRRKEKNVTYIIVSNGWSNYASLTQSYFDSTLVRDSFPNFGPFRINIIE